VSRILVVDDDRTVSDVVSRYLQPDGHDVAVVADDYVTKPFSPRELVLRSLTAREYDLLVFLLGSSRVAFTREQLFERVWGWSFGAVCTVTVHVRRLRGKVEDDPAQPGRLVTVWGVGYRYEPITVPA
jgi:DNA-binding response OmpR family regulator